MLGSGEDVKKELDSRLTAARIKWQLQQRNPDLAPNLSRDQNYVLTNQLVGDTQFSERAARTDHHSQDSFLSYVTLEILKAPIFVLLSFNFIIIFIESGFARFLPKFVFYAISVFVSSLSILGAVAFVGRIKKATTSPIAYCLLLIFILAAISHAQKIFW